MFKKNSPDTGSVSNSEAAPSNPGRSDMNQDNGISISGLTDNDKAKQSQSVIDEWLTMKGDLESEGDILIKGKVIGNVHCKMLILDTDAIVEGGIIADEVVIRGTTKGGEVQAKRVLLQATARVMSEIVHDKFSAEEGAYIEGGLRRLENESAEAGGGTKTAARKVKKADNTNTETMPSLSSQNGIAEVPNGSVTHN